MFDDWKTAQKENGLRFISQLNRFGTFGTLRSVRQGIVQIQSDSTAATFDLKEARFTSAAPCKLGRTGRTRPWSK